jgi:hypothetical protein
MKKTTCNDLRGACDADIRGETAEEMGEASKAHVMEMIGAGDEAHQAAVDGMMALTQDEQRSWYTAFVTGFDALPDA